MGSRLRDSTNVNADSHREFCGLSPSAAMSADKVMNPFKDDMMNPVNVMPLAMKSIKKRSLYNSRRTQTLNLQMGIDFGSSLNAVA